MALVHSWLGPPGLRTALLVSYQALSGRVKLGRPERPGLAGLNTPTLIYNALYIPESCPSYTNTLRR